jgi:hypothetical protein
MPLAVAVPLNTMLADLDEGLRTLLKRELAHHAFDGVEVAFEAPAKEWSATLSGPTVDLFLYDLRESADWRPTDWEVERRNGRTRELRPPMRLEASYAITAWTRAVQDEHRLLSQVLSVLYAHSSLPRDVLGGTLAGQDPERFPVDGRVGQSRGDKADFWTAVGGQYKPSLDYVVTLAGEAGTAVERGRDVRTRTLLLETDAGRSTREEFHGAGGIVRDAAGAPAPDAWVALPDEGRWTATDGSGAFRFDRLHAATYRCVARAADGREGEADIVVPGTGAEIALHQAPRRAKR